MKLRLLAACAAMSCLFATAASATVPITATLAAPVAAATQLIAGGAIWRCDGTTCVAGAADRTTMSLDTCKQLARRVGQVTAFTSNARALDEGQLTRCNASAR